MNRYTPEKSLPTGAVMPIGRSSTLSSSSLSSTSSTDWAVPAATADMLSAVATRMTVVGGKRRLPPSFEPTPHTVICGRGKDCFEAIGNRRFRILVSTFLEKYSGANSKFEKSLIVSNIVDMIREASPEGGFVKYEDGCWWEVSDNTAREKVGACLRDCLHSQYRSSSKAKLARRQAKKLGNTSHSTPGSPKSKAIPKTGQEEEVGDDPRRHRGDDAIEYSDDCPDHPKKEA